MSFDCGTCDRYFGSKDALEQHLRDSTVHAPSFYCDTCDRYFDCKRALDQHLRDSPVHAQSFDCDTCDKCFGSKEALDQHLRNSPVHAPSFDCDTCDRQFDSKKALDQHLRDSTVHAPSFDCDTCDRYFANKEALQQHLRESRNHRQAAETPIDIFFGSFPGFNYDPSHPPATSYAYLQKHEGWRRGDVVSKDSWVRYQDALESELRMWYGAEDDLTAWHALCRAVGIDPLPQTCSRCEKVRTRHTTSASIHVNPEYRMYEGHTSILLT